MRQRTYSARINATCQEAAPGQPPGSSIGREHSVRENGKRVMVRRESGTSQGIQTPPGGGTRASLLTGTKGRKRFSEEGERELRREMQMRMKKGHSWHVERGGGTSTHTRGAPHGWLQQHTGPSMRHPDTPTAAAGRRASERGSEKRKRKLARNVRDRSKERVNMWGEAGGPASHGLASVTHRAQACHPDTPTAGAGRRATSAGMEREERA